MPRNVVPVGIALLYQLDLPLARPFLDGLFPRDASTTNSYSSNQTSRMTP